MELKMLVVFQTVENTDEQKAQADALSVIFTLAKENVTYAKEMDGLLANKMILKVLLTPNCEPGYHFVKVYIGGLVFMFAFFAQWTHLNVIFLYPYILGYCVRFFTNYFHFVLGIVLRCLRRRSIQRDRNS